MKKFIVSALFIITFGFSAQSQTYCIPSSNCVVSAITNFYTTTLFQNIKSSPSGCSNYSHTTNNFAIFSPGDVFKFTLNGSGVYSTGYTIWVDWNSDGDFADAGEKVWSSKLTTATALSDSFTTPSNTKYGQKRLRIRSNYYSIPADPCVNQSYGETEDYNVIVAHPSGVDFAFEKVESPAVFVKDTNIVTFSARNVSKKTIYYYSVGMKLDNNSPQLITSIADTLVSGERVVIKLPKLIIGAGGYHTLKIWVYSPNGASPDSASYNDSFETSFCTGHKGTYTIGATGDYASFADAITAIKNCGVGGPTVFNIQPGTYNEKVSFTKLTGLSSTNTLTFDGLDKTKVTLTYAGTNSTNAATLVFDGAEFITFKNMKIVASSSSYCIGVFLTNQANKIGIIGCNIVVSAGGGNNGCILAAATQSSTTGNNISSINIENNSLTGGNYGVALYGVNYQNLSPYNKIIGNTFSGQGSYGIVMTAQLRAIIQYNVISNMVYSSGICINLTNYNSGTWIDGNKLSPGTTGIYSSYENYLYSDSSVFSNNIITSFSNTSIQRGIHSYYDWNLRIYHNSILVNGSTANDSTSAAMYFYYATNPVILNNIFASTSKTMLLSIRPYTFASIAPIEIDYNLYYYPGSTTKMFFHYTTSYYNVTGFKTAVYRLKTGHDGHSLDQKNPNFLSSSNLHLNASVAGYNGVKMWISKDVDGDSRCIYSSTIGADESPFTVAKPTAGFVIGNTLCFSSPVICVNNAKASDPTGHKWYLNGKYQTNTLNFEYIPVATVHYDTIKLVSSNCGGKDSISKVVKINPPTSKPIVGFISDKNIIAPYDEVKFYDGSSNCPQKWEWLISPEMHSDPYLGSVNAYYYINFTDKYSQNPNVRFEFPGKYTVKLKVSNSKGTDSIISKDYIIVIPIQNMCEWVASEIQNSVNGLLYDDGGPQSNYSNNVNCSVLLTPCTDTLYFTFSEFDLLAGDYLRIYDGANNAGQKLWNVGYYGTNGLTGDMTNSAFSKTLMATSGFLYFEFSSNNNNQQGKGFGGEWYGTALNKPKPVAKFTCDDTVCMNVPVSFINLSTGDNLSYEWDFDGSGYPTSYSKNDQFTYSFAGVYPVKLKVSNCGGDSTYIRNVVVVSPVNAPVPDFVADVKKPLRLIDVVTFTDLSKGCVDDWKWKITPNTFSIVKDFPNGQNPKITFNDKGCYTVTLVASYGGNKDSITKTCYIDPVDYCIPVVTNLNADLGISRVTIGSIDNLTSAGVKEYSDYAGSKVAILDQQVKYLITVARSTTKNAMTRKVWIDWNIDGDFNDAGELVAQEGSASTISWSDSILVPSTSAIGATRMRVGVCISGFPNNPCGPNYFGEYEDYRIIVRTYSIPPEVTLIGPNPVYYKQCDRSHIDSGATAKSVLFGSLTNKIVVTDNIDWNLPGTYWRTYSVMDSYGNQGSSTRMVFVVTETVPPQLVLKGSNPLNIEVGSVFADPGYIVSDTCSGLDSVSVTGKVNTNFLSSYTIEYKAVDKAGNFTTVNRVVNVKDITSPTVTLVGKVVDSIEVHNTYNDPGVTTIDNYDPNPKITKSGTVDIHKLGSYKIEYYAKDSSGNSSVVLSRNVVVFDKTSPKIISNYNWGDTIVHNVLSFLQTPVKNITDNYYSTFTVDSTGTYYSAFVNGYANKLGNYTLYYNVSDGSGNSATAFYNIKVVDKVKPVVSMLGDGVLNICKWHLADTTDLLVGVSDNFDSNPTLIVTGSYYTKYIRNTSLTGFYSIVYKGVDQSGNISDSVIRYVNVKICGGIDDNELVNRNIIIYPNPSSGIFYLRNLDSESQLIGIEVLSSLGSVVYSNRKPLEISGVLELNLNFLSNGMYFIKMETAKGASVQKLDISR